MVRGASGSHLNGYEALSAETDATAPSLVQADVCVEEHADLRGWSRRRRNSKDSTEYKHPTHHTHRALVAIAPSVFVSRNAGREQAFDNNLGSL